VPPGVVVAHGWDEAAAGLAHGGKVVLFPARLNPSMSLPGKFLPVFWSPVWFPTQKPNTMGILCDPKHPVFAQFPTEFYSNWQWWNLIQNSRTAILSETPATFRPLVQVIDNLARNDKLGNLFEARVSGGRLLVCCMDLPGIAERDPAARQLLKSLYAYAGSRAFEPAQKLDAEWLARLCSFKESTLHKLGARVIRVGSEDTAGGNVAANAIDGDPETFWHTQWQPSVAPMPHELVIDLGGEVNLTGITYLPRQDMSNGRIGQAEVLADGKPVASFNGRNDGNLQTVRFKAPVRARQLTLRITSEVGGNPFAAVAELDVLTQ
jgi:hypothetical protein